VHLGNQWSNKGIFYFQMNDFDSSLYCFEQSLEVRKKLNNPKDLLESYYNLAEYYKARNEINKAIIYFDRAREIANKSNLFDDQIDVLKQLVYCWKALKQFDNAQDAQLILTSLESNKQEKWGIDNDVIEFAISPIVSDDTTFQKSSNTLEYFLVSITVILGIFILRKKF
jgi:tetratricopeptide (TPR) repeat protein